MKKPVSSPYGWEPTVNTQTEQCICCKEMIPARRGIMPYRSKQPTSRSHICPPCYNEHIATGRSLMGISRYRHEGRISTREKQSRAARERELAKGHTVKV